MKPLYLVLTLIILFTINTGVAGAESLRGNGTIVAEIKDAKDYEYTNVSQYTFNQPGETIIEVVHTVPMGTIVLEKYYYGNNIINTRFDCSWSYFTQTCNLNISSGEQSVDYVRQNAQLIPADTNIVTEVIINSTKIYGFGIFVQGFQPFFLTPRDEFLPPHASIQIPELGYTQIQALSGTSSQPTDVTVRTVTYDQHIEYYNEVQESKSLIDMFWAFWNTTSSLATTLFYFFKLIFYDHPILTFALFETYALMYALDAKNMMQWWQRFVDVHIKLYNFISGIINKIIEVIK